MEEQKVFIEINGVKRELKDRSADIEKVMEEVAHTYKNLNHRLKEFEIPLKLSLEYYENPNDTLHLTPENRYRLSEIVRIIKSRFSGTFSMFDKDSRFCFKKCCGNVV